MVVDDTHANAVEEHEHILEIHHDERLCLFILLSKLILYYNKNYYYCGSKTIQFLCDKRVDPSKKIGTERVAVDMLNCLHPQIPRFGTPEGVAARLTPLA